YVPLSYWPAEYSLAFHKVERHNHIVNVSTTTCNIVGAFVVLLTFGMTYAPLAVIILIYIYTSTGIACNLVYSYWEFLNKQIKYTKEECTKSAEKRQNSGGFFSDDEEEVNQDWNKNEYALLTVLYNSCHVRSRTSNTPRPSNNHPNRGIIHFDSDI